MKDAYAMLATAIRDRRTVRDFNGEKLERATVEEILNDAVWAPYHSRKEPWRFILFMEDGRERFADAVCATYSPEIKRKWEAWARDQYCNLMQAHLIVVYQSAPGTKFEEDALSATAALIHNIGLLAWQRGVGTVWKTNECNWQPDFHRAVGLKDGERIAGIVHLGYFDKMPASKKRTPIDQLLTVIDVKADEPPDL